MARPLRALLLLLLPMAAGAADDTRISFLEQEVRNLQRQVQALSMQMNDLQRRPDRITSAPRAATSTATPPGSDAWIDADKWKRVHRGMSELEVVELLGPPTSMRDEQGARVLLYALEVGSSGFLGGSVRIRNRVVDEVKTPTLQ
jgi:hypothetical protein